MGSPSSSPVRQRHASLDSGSLMIRHDFPSPMTTLPLLNRPGRACSLRSTWQTRTVSNSGSSLFMRLAHPVAQSLHGPGSASRQGRDATIAPCARIRPVRRFPSLPAQIRNLEKTHARRYRIDSGHCRFPGRLADGWAPGNCTISRSAHQPQPCLTLACPVIAQPAANPVSWSRSDWRDMIAR